MIDAQWASGGDKTQRFLQNDTKTIAISLWRNADVTFVTPKLQSQSYPKTVNGTDGQTERLQKKAKWLTPGFAGNTKSMVSVKFFH